MMLSDLLFVKSRKKVYSRVVLYKYTVNHGVV